MKRKRFTEEQISYALKQEGGEKLDGDETVGSGFQGFVDHTRAAVAELLENLVV